MKQEVVSKDGKEEKPAPSPKPAPEPAAAPEAVAPSGEAKPEYYDLHIKVPSEMRQVLKDAAELAYKMEDIEKPDLVDLMNLFIGWGLNILKKKWLDRMGYR